MRKIIIYTLFLLSSILIYSQEVLTNNTIIELYNLGFDNQIIKSKINSSQTDFDTSLEVLKDLKDKGIPSDVIAAMIDKTTVTTDSGIFFYIDSSELKEIEPSVFSGTRTNALGAAFSYGIAPAKIKSYINNASSANKINRTNQIFIFQFGNTQKADLGDVNWWFKSATSPNEFVLTTLKQKKNKNQRQLVVGKVTGITASSQMGVDTKDAIPFTVEEIGKGRYKVTPKAKLEPGEYCFFYQGTIPLGGFNNQSVFDFSIE
ncbi:hypothetical protein [Sinomicrobium pectinilyticum]|nr:hypothetical protein [Sinomicrobium pectinilyticum]